MDLDGSFSQNISNDVSCSASSGSATSRHRGFAAPYEATQLPVIIIHGCPLYRDCFMRAVVAALPNQIVAYAGAQAFLDLSQRDAALVILCTSGIPRDEIKTQLDALLAAGLDSPIALVGDDEPAMHIRQLMASGISGYVPTSLPLATTIEALNFIKAGGTFAPADSLLHVVDRHSPAPPPANAAGAAMFTAKQIAVIEAIRRGKANKVIAYELNMCESTVKVHVRNIMKKLQAKNRTQVALLTEHLIRLR